MYNIYNVLCGNCSNFYELLKRKAASWTNMMRRNAPLPTTTEIVKRGVVWRKKSFAERTDSSGRLGRNGLVTERNEACKEQAALYSAFEQTNVKQTFCEKRFWSCKHFFFVRKHLPLPPLQKKIKNSEMEDSGFIDCELQTAVSYKGRFLFDETCLGVGDCKLQQD